MRILLIWPNVEGIDFLNLLPLGLGCLAANVPIKHEIKIWDGILRRLPNERMVQEVEKFKPHVVGISIWNFNIASSRRVITMLKDMFPSVIVVVGGPAPSAAGKDILKIVKADYAFVGDSESSFPQFLEFLSDGFFYESDKTKISGLIFKNEKGDIIMNSLEWPSLEKLKYCDYELINLREYLYRGYYYGMHSGVQYTAPIMTTRGCPFCCAYCSASLINGSLVRTRSVGSIISEILYLYRSFNIKGFNIIDDNFTFNIGFAKKICNALIELKLSDISFNCPNGVRLEYLDNELLQLMKSAGWQCIFIAPESGSKKTLENMHKRINLEMVKEKLILIKKAKMKTFGFFMIGYPGENIKDIRETINFACRNDFDFAVFTCFQPLVGTPVYKRLLDSKQLDILNIENADYYRITYAPSGLTVNSLRILRLYALVKFYLLSLRRLRNVLSVYSLKRIGVFLKKVLI